MRRTKTRRQKNDELRRRYDAIKNLMSTFAMSTVAVVAVVTLIPASPKADIIKTVALSNEVTYQVSVTDEDNALDLDTLVVVLENQLEYYEEPIELGESSGYFDGLHTNTQYRLSVYGDKGFGGERLDTILVTTRPKDGATILSVTNIGDGHHPAYEVDVSVYDPDDIYTDITLQYGYAWELDGELLYSSVPITQDRQTIELLDVWTEYPFHIYLEGTTEDGTELLDEIWVTPPFQLNASIYSAYYNNHQIAFHPYGDSYVEEFSFRMNIYRNDMLIRTETFVPSSDHHGHEKWLIDDLQPDTFYRFEAIALYQNPQTLRMEEQVIMVEEYTTTKDYRYTYQKDIQDGLIDILLEMDDPENVIDYIYYEVYDQTGEFEVLMDSGSVPMELMDDTEQATLSITIPDIESYQIYIGIRSNTNLSVNEILDTITSD